MSKSESIKTMLYYGKPYKKWIIICFIFSVLNVVVNISIPLTYKLILDMVVQNNNNEQFLIYVGILISLLVLGTLNMFLIKLSSSRFIANTLMNLRNKIVEHIQFMEYKDMKKHHSGDLASRVNDDLELIRNFVVDLLDFIYQPIIFITAVTYAFFISWKLLLVTVMVLIIAMLLNNVGSKPLKKLSGELQKLYGKATSMIQDTINGIYVLKSYNLEETFQNNYKKVQSKAYHTEMSIARRKLILLTIQTLLLVVPIQIINLYGGSLSFNGEITVGEFGMFLALITYFTYPVNKLISLIGNTKLAKGGADRINEILSYIPENSVHHHSHFIKKDHNTTIEFNNVHFSYDGKQTVLKDVHFKLRPNKTIALVGPSGGGKSTILNLVSGFYKHTHGEIKIFGNNIDNISTADVRSQISMVTQDAHIYPTTILENIGYGKQSASMDEVIRAAKQANAHNFILKLTNGYNTVLTEGGSNLSGGQKQRITIARAILKDAPLLLLDEPTSALDQGNEKQVNKALTTLTKNKSVIIVAHRLSTVINADEIMVLDQGDIVERGHHHSLMSLDGLYKELYLKQRVEENILENKSRSHVNKNKAITTDGV